MCPQCNVELCTQIDPIVIDAHVYHPRGQASECHGILGCHGQYQLAAVPFASRVGMTLGEK